MARSYTAEELINSVKLLAAVPNTSATGSADADILRYLNEELSTTLIPWVMQVQEEYYVVTERVTIDGTTDRFRVNHRALGQILRDVVLVDSGNDNRRVMIPQIPRERLPFFDADFLVDIEGFYMEGSDVILVDVDTTASGALELSYFFRPGELVLSTAARKITAVDTGTKTITIAAAPTAWATSDKYDIHSGKSGAEIRQWDLTVTSDPDTTMTFNEEIDETVYGRRAVEVGDWVCLAEEAALPGLPKELHPTLAQAASLRLLEARGDFEALERGRKTLDRMMTQAHEYLETRVRGKAHKITGSYEAFGGYTYRGRGWYALLFSLLPLLCQ